MSPWIIGALGVLAAYFVFLGWYLRRSFPDGELTVGAFGHEKTFRWGDVQEGQGDLVRFVAALRRKYKCGICQAEFDTIDELRLHQQLGHLK